MARASAVVAKQGEVLKILAGGENGKCSILIIIFQFRPLCDDERAQLFELLADVGSGCVLTPALWKFFAIRACSKAPALRSVGAGR